MNDDSHLENLLEKWEESHDQGHDPSVEDLCRTCPELIEPLKKKIQALEEINNLLGSVDGLGSENPGLPKQAGNFIAEIDLDQCRFHAQGGLGVIYMARDKQLNRQVAVKFMRPEFSSHPARRERFCFEAEITSRLDHPGVVPVHGYGITAEDCPFYVMRFVDGRTLEAAIERYHSTRHEWNEHQCNLEFRMLLNRFISICNTIAYVHNRGIVHRDIKPVNVMLGRYGETLVVDWGLAVPVHQEHSENFSGEHTLLLPHSGDPSSPGDPVAGAGTPAYMSPEQLEDGWTASPSADIYSLGAVLYKILTGLPLFETGDLSPAEIRSRIRSASFPKPTDRIKDVPKPLEAICLKAMAQNPSDRYKNALKIADDVEGYLGDEDIPVYRESFLEKNLRRLRRHQGIARSIALFSVILVIVLTISSLSLGILANKERAAKLEADAANKASLKTAAKFASQTVALVIKERWRILKMEASDPELISYLSDLNQAGTIPDWTRLYRWLLRAQSDNAVTQAESWFLCDATGKQLARFPNSEKTVGESFAHRDYYHGNGMDLPVGEIGKPSHITYPHLSAVYTSRNNQAMKVAFSIPIWSERNLTPNTTFLGVLGMSIKLGHFEILQQQLGNDQVAVLAQLGNDHLEQKEESLGLILHHPFLSVQHEKIQKGEISKPRLSPELVILLNSLDPKGPGVIRSSYQDPVGGEYKGDWIAAAQRVHIEGWQGKHLNPNWVVLVQKRMPAD